MTQNQSITSLMYIGKTPVLIVVEGKILLFFLEGGIGWGGWMGAEGMWGEKSNLIIGFEK